MLYLHLLRNLAQGLCNPIILGLVVLLVISACRKDPVRRRNDFMTAIGYAALCGFGLQVERFIVWLRPTTIDGTLLQIDRAIGLDPNRFSYWLYTHHYYALIFLVVVYQALASVIVIAWSAEQSAVLRRALLISIGFCWFLYALFPAVGPIYYSHGLTANLPRNCIPSMHFTWALLLAINSRSWLRWPLWIYAAMVGVSTIALGQHYYIDLIVAIPYTMAMQYMAILLSSRSTQWMAMRQACSGSVGPAVPMSVTD